MSNPVVAQVDSLNGNEGAEQEQFQYGEAEPGLIHRKYKRVYEHYIENNMTSTGYTEIVDANDHVTAWRLDEGWHLIPYWNPGVAMTQGELAQIGALGQGIRIDSLGFKVLNAQMFRTDIAAIQGVTELSNIFVDTPNWETYSDTLHQYEGHVLHSTDPNDGQHPGYLPIYSNNNMTSQEVLSYQAGLLPRVSWAWHHFGTAPYPNVTQDLYRLRRGTAAEPFGVSSTLNATGRQAMSTRALHEWGHTWINKDKNAWYPFCAPTDNTIWPAWKAINDEVPGIFPLQRQSILTGANGPDSTGVVRRGTNIPNMKHNRWAVLDWDTMTALPQHDTPPDMFIKTQRMHDVSSPMRIAGRLLIEYTCSVTIQPSESFYTGSNTAQIGSNSTNVDRTQVNEYTTGPGRKWRVWGIPALSIAAANTVSGTVHLPPWRLFDLWTSVTMPPVAGFIGDWPGGDKPNGLFTKPPLLYTSIITEDGSISANVLYCLLTDWEGIPALGPGESRSSFMANNFQYPALASYESAIEEDVFVWVMEAIAIDEYTGAGPAKTVVTNPLYGWLGPANPASNIIHLFSDAGPTRSSVEVDAPGPSKKKAKLADI